MKRLIISVLTVLSLVLVPVQVLAAHFWEVKMSDPTTAEQSRTFNIEYTALSVEVTDEITVTLFEDGVAKDSQTTIAGGDSGAFTVTVPSDGSYTYSLEADSSLDENPKTTDERVVTVTTPEEGEASVITVTDPSSGAGGGTGGAAGEGDGSVQAESDTEGDVGEDGASTENDGDEGQDDSASQTARDRTIWGIIIGLALLAALYYWFYYRQGKTLFGKKED